MHHDDLAGDQGLLPLRSVVRAEIEQVDNQGGKARNETTGNQGNIIVVSVCSGQAFKGLQSSLLNAPERARSTRALRAFAQGESKGPFDGDMSYWVYILRLADGTLYTGSTSDLNTRLKDHRRWAGGAFTRVPGKKELIYSEDYPNRVSAERRERQLNGWSRAKKLALVRDEKESLQRLARRKS